LNAKAGTITWHEADGSPTSSTINEVELPNGSLDITGNKLTYNMRFMTNHTTVALSDNTSTVTTGADKAFFRAPYALTIKDVRAAVLTASSSGVVTFNVLKNGVTIFSTKVTIDQSETTSVTGTPYVLSTTTAASDDVFTFDIDTAGSGTVGAQVRIYYTPQ
jgi:hypothetical protein